MPKKEKRAFKPLPKKTKVHWDYHSGIGHGEVVSVFKMGTTAENTIYNVREFDHHKGEKSILHHSGKALKKS